MAEAVGYAADRLLAGDSRPSSPLVLKHDRLFLLSDLHGDIVPPGRLLARPLPRRHPDPQPLRARGRGRPSGRCCPAQIPSAYEAQIDLAVNDLPFGGNRWDPKNVVHIRRQILLADRLIERMTLASHLPDAARLLGGDRPSAAISPTSSRCAAGSAPAGASSTRRGPRATASCSPTAGSTDCSSGASSGSATRRTGSPPRRRGGISGCTPGERVELEWEITAEVGDDGVAVPLQGFDESRATLDREYRAWRESTSRWDDRQRRVRPPHPAGDGRPPRPLHRGGRRRP